MTVLIETPGFPYFSQTPDGRAEGLIADLWRAWSESEGMEVAFLLPGDAGMDTAETNGPLAVCGFSFPGMPAGRKDVSRKIRSFPNYLFFPPDERYGDHALVDLRLGVVAGTPAQAYLERNTETVPVVHESYSALIRAVEKKRIQAALAESLAFHAHLAGQVPKVPPIAHPVKPLFHQDLTVSVRGGDAGLVERIDRGFARIDSLKVIEIPNEGAVVVHGSAYWWRWAALAAAVVLGGLLIVLAWNYQLRRAVSASTRALQEKNAVLSRERTQTDAILRSMSSLVVEVARTGHIRRVVPTGFRTIDLDRDRLAGKYVGPFVPLLSPGRIEKILDGVLVKKGQTDIQQLVKMDRDRWVNICLTPLDEDSVLMVMNDLSEIRESEKRYKDLVELADCVIFKLDEHGHVIFVNRYTEALFGFTREELLGKKPSETFMARMKAERGGYSPAGPADLGDASVELENNTQGGDRIIVSYRIRLLFRGETKTGELWVGVDVTRRRNVQVELAQRERYYGSLIENSSDLITVMDEAGRLVSESPAIEAILGYGWGETHGSEMTSHIHPDDIETYQTQLRHLEENKVHRLELRRRHKNGAWIHLECIANCLLDDPAVQGIVFNSRDITERRAYEEERHRTAFYDPLTGLPNRSLFIERLRHAMERYRRNPDRAYAVLFVDVDRFKVINDSLGHYVGDGLLKNIGNILAGSFRRVDTVARFGGDEFVLLLDEIEDERSAIKVAERILAAVNAPVVIEGHEVFSSVSIGIVFGMGHYREPAEILRDADTAMHQAKSEDKGGYRIFHTQMHSRVRKLLEMETDLRRALEREEFEVHYQPIVDMGTQNVRALEALIRWRHPERGMVSPMEFIPLAEETGLIGPIGDWVLEQACREVRPFMGGNGNGCGQLSLNLSARQFLDPGLAEKILSTIQRVDVDPGHIKLEITETTLMQNGDQASRIIGRLREVGISIAIDDFGTGYSSLSYLQQYPFDTLKIDRSFVNMLEAGYKTEADIILVILSLARTLGMDVVAEGIETTFQQEALLQMGCRLGQGYLFARPMDVESLQRFLEDRPPMMATKINRTIGSG